MKISPEEARANVPPTPLSGIETGIPTTEIAEPKLAVEQAAERRPVTVALQLTIFWARLYFSQCRDNVQLQRSDWPQLHLPFAF